MSEWIEDAVGGMLLFMSSAMTLERAAAGSQVQAARPGGALPAGSEGGREVTSKCLPPTLVSMRRHTESKPDPRSENSTSTLTSPISFFRFIFGPANPKLFDSANKLPHQRQSD